MTSLTFRDFTQGTSVEQWYYAIYWMITTVRNHKAGGVCMEAALHRSTPALQLQALASLEWRSAGGRGAGGQVWEAREARVGCWYLYRSSLLLYAARLFAPTKCGASSFGSSQFNTYIGRCKSTGAVQIG